MFYGSGAGKLPTASAVVADVVDEAKHLHKNIMTNWSSKPLELIPMDEVEGRFFVRVEGTTVDQVEAVFDDVEIVNLKNLPGEFGFITTKMKQGEYLGSIPPYGFQIEKIDGKRTLVSEPVTSEIVREIFNRYASWGDICISCKMAV